MSRLEIVTDCNLAVDDEARPQDGVLPNRRAGIGIGPEELAGGKADRDRVKDPCPPAQGTCAELDQKNPPKYCPFSYMYQIKGDNACGRTKCPCRESSTSRTMGYSGMYSCRRHLQSPGSNGDKRAPFCGRKKGTRMS